jgi:hypothetical protein
MIKELLLLLLLLPPPPRDFAQEDRLRRSHVNRPIFRGRAVFPTTKERFWFRALFQGGGQLFPPSLRGRKWATRDAWRRPSGGAELGGPATCGSRGGRQPSPRQVLRIVFNKSNNKRTGSLLLLFLATSAGFVVWKMQYTYVLVKVLWTTSSSFAFSSLCESYPLVCPAISRFHPVPANRGTRRLIREP